MTCYSPLKGFEDKENGGIVFKRSLQAGAAMEVACGQCIGCRIDKSKEWAARIVHESQMHQENTFVTLTYDEKNLPSDGSLNKAHFQKFMKRLRKKYENKKIRYFHCGEYGETDPKGNKPKNYLGRPHYHACIFGIDFSDRIPFSATNGITTYVSEELTKTWGMGFTTCGNLEYDSAAYCSRYIMKKITGFKSEEHYKKFDIRTGEIYDLQPEYVTMSLGRTKGNGIGGTFYEKYKTDFFPRDECPVPGKGVYKKVPRYYEQIYAEQNPQEYEDIKKRREIYRQKHETEYTAASLMDKYKVKKAQLAHLPRN